MKKIRLLLVVLITPLLWRGAGGEAFAQSKKMDSLKVELNKAV